jgi:hypothetical protein
MAICVDMALDTIDLRVVCGDSAIKVETQDLIFIFGKVLGGDFGLSGRVLGGNDVAGIEELVTALIADAIIELLVGTVHEASWVVIAVGRQIGDDVNRCIQFLTHGIVGVPPDLGSMIQRLPRICVVGVSNVNVIVP